MLGRIQNELFDLGADLATPGEDFRRGALRIAPDQVDRLEREIDAMNEDLEPLRELHPARRRRRLGRSSTSPAPSCGGPSGRRWRGRGGASIRSRSPISIGCRTICSCLRVGWRVTGAATSSGSRARRAKADTRSSFVLEPARGDD